MFSLTPTGHVAPSRPISSRRWSAWRRRSQQARQAGPRTGTEDDSPGQARRDQEKLLAVLDPTDRDLEDAIERLRMLQLVEQGLAVGDVLPDFAARPDGRIVASEELLAAGRCGHVLPRALVPLLQPDARGIERSRAADRGAGRVGRGLSPCRPGAWAARHERGLGCTLLSDPARPTRRSAACVSR